MFGTDIFVCMTDSYHIVIIDDHTLFLKGLYGIIKDRYPDATIHCYESIEQCQKSKTDFNSASLLISDIELPNENVFSFLKQTMQNYEQLPILVITMHKKLSVIRKCKNLNVNGYLLKDDDELLHQAITETLSGNTFYSPRIEKLYRSYARQLNMLSPREEEVTKMIGLGLSNKEISEELFVSIETVKSHKKNIKIKLGISEQSDLIQYANQHFLI